MVTTDPAGNLSRKELLILLLYAPVSEEEFKYPIRGRTRLVKMLFLFRNELWKRFRFDKILSEDVLPEFKAWKFGPYSKEIFSDIDFFKSVGFLEQTGSSEPASREEALELSHWSGTETVGYGSPAEAAIDEYEEEEFLLSNDGALYVLQKKLWEKLTEDQQQALRTFKKKMTEAPLYAILSYVYEKYPEMTENSEIRQRFSF